MAERITKESWERISKGIIDIVEEGRDLGLDYYTAYDLEAFLTDEGIIEVIKDQD